jgi:hypothetical protein
VCKAGAINFDMKEEVRDLSVGAVIRDDISVTGGIAAG